MIRSKERDLVRFRVQVLLINRSIYWEHVLKRTIERDDVKESLRRQASTLYSLSKPVNWFIGSIRKVLIVVINLPRWIIQRNTCRVRDNCLDPVLPVHSTKMNTRFQILILVFTTPSFDTQSSTRVSRCSHAFQFRMFVLSNGNCSRCQIFVIISLHCSCSKSPERCSTALNDQVKIVLITHQGKWKSLELVANLLNRDQLFVCQDQRLRFCRCRWINETAENVC